MGALVLSRDTARLDIRIREAQANIVRIEAPLEEQVNGPRIEAVEASRMICGLLRPSAGRATVLNLEASCSKPCPRHRAYKEFRH